MPRKRKLDITEYNNFQTKTDDGSIVLDDSVKLISSYVKIGIGFLF